MMKKGVFLLIAPLLVGILLIPAFSQEDMVVVDDGGFTKKQRPPAVFRHDEHNEIALIEECNACHHIYENGEKSEDESSEDQSCSECHDENGSGNKPGLRKAFHTNCKGCHHENKKGPIMCGQCHVR
jgi:predicted CXXCH cytochrome family protein